MIVEVTQSDIDNGVREDASHCPIAHAIVRAVSGNGSSVNQLDVDAYGATVLFDDLTTLVLDIPPVGQRFIEEFDEGVTVSPVTLDLNVRSDDRITW